MGLAGRSKERVTARWKQSSPPYRHSYLQISARLFQRGASPIQTSNTESNPRIGLSDVIDTLMPSLALLANVQLSFG